MSLLYSLYNVLYYIVFRGKTCVKGWKITIHQLELSKWFLLMLSVAPFITDNQSLVRYVLPSWKPCMVVVFWSLFFSRLPLTWIMLLWPSNTWDEIPGKVLLILKVTIQPAHTYWHLNVDPFLSSIELFWFSVHHLIWTFVEASWAEQLFRRA